MTGTGTIGDPYIISTATDLQNMKDDLDAYYELADNVDASATSTWNSNAGFDPVTPFTGQLDGKGYAVDALTIDRSAGTGTVSGLFNVNSGTIKNLGLTDVDITGDWAAPLIGYSNSGTIQECYVTGAIKDSTAVAFYGAGFCNINTGTIKNCYSRCSVTDGTGFAYGFVGNNTGGTVLNCFATGAVSGASVNKGFDAGNGTITGCFFDKETSGQTSGTTATGKTTAEMKIHHTYLVASWDFKKIWKIDAGVNNAYPSLGQITSIGERDVWLEGPYLCYYDDYGNKRKVEGLPAASGLPWWYFT